MRTLATLLAALLIGACSSGEAAPPTDDTTPPRVPPTVNPADVRMAAAQTNYESYCAHCHGWSGEGQPPNSVERTRSLGYHIVPRHDSQGHTWQHPDQLLFEVIKYGVENPLNQYVMTGYEGVLDDDEIWAVIDYMRRFWTDDQRAHQADLTAQYADLHPNWSE